MICAWCCTDGGLTGRSLSLVSKKIHRVSRSAKFQSIAIRGVWQAVQFLEILEAMHPNVPLILDLFVTDEFPYDKITRHMEGCTATPQRLNPLFGGQWFTSRYDKATATDYMRERRIGSFHDQMKLKDFLTHSPSTTISRQRSRSANEQRREQVIAEFLDDLSTRGNKRMGTSSRINRHVMRTCQGRILEILAPHLATYATTLPMFPPCAYSTDGTHRRITFPHLKELNAITFVMDWLYVCPSLQHMSMHGRESSMCSFTTRKPHNDASVSLTHVAFNLPLNTYLAECWAKRGAEENFRTLGIGEPLVTRCSRATKPHYIPSAVTHIMLRIDTSHIGEPLER